MEKIPVLIVSAGTFHPPLLGRIAFFYFLTKNSRYRVYHISSLERLPKMDLEGIKALVLYYHQKLLSIEALEALDSYVFQGGGILAIHSATASFMNNLRYFQILGGRFSGHGPVSSFTLTPRPESHVLFQDMPSFSVRDELYTHEFLTSVDVHFTARLKGEDIPVVWTKMHGAGRICYACPGHTTHSLSHPVYQHLLQRGLDWVAEGTHLSAQDTE